MGRSVLAVNADRACAADALAVDPDRAYAGDPGGGGAVEVATIRGAAAAPNAGAAALAVDPVAGTAIDTGQAARPVARSMPHSPTGVAAAEVATITAAADSLNTRATDTLAEDPVAVGAIEAGQSVRSPACVPLGPIGTAAAEVAGDASVAGAPHSVTTADVAAVDAVAGARVAAVDPGPH